MHNASERIWAEGYIEVLLELQGFKVTSAHRIMIRDAMNLLASTEADRRTMTDFVATLQDEKNATGTTVLYP
ncbi:hypothetical protein ACFS07_35950 [Undibacterium arcticum]